MTSPRGRSGDGSAPRGIFPAAISVLTVLAAATACAQPGNTPAAPATEVTGQVQVSAVPAMPFPVESYLSRGPRNPPRPISPQRGVAPCAQTGPPAVATKPTSTRRPTPRPSMTTHPRGSGPNDAGRPRGSDPDDARRRAEQVLEGQRAAIPRRGDVPPAAATGAANCVVLLRAEFSLRAAAGPLTSEVIRATLIAAGLFKPAVQPDLRFAASTGKACIVGTVTANKPAMAIAPLPAEGPCRP